MLLLDNFGSSILLYFLTKIEKFVENNSQFTPEAKHDIVASVETLKKILPFLEKMHRALFYCGGLYYQTSKRITSIHYVSLIVSSFKFVRGCITKLIPSGGERLK